MFIAEIAEKCQQVFCSRANWTRWNCRNWCCYERTVVPMHRSLLPVCLAVAWNTTRTVWCWFVYIMLVNIIQAQQLDWDSMLAWLVTKVALWSWNLWQTLANTSSPRRICQRQKATYWILCWKIPNKKPRNCCKARRMLQSLSIAWCPWLISAVHVS